MTRQTASDPLADPVDRPGRTPDAHIRHATETDKKRDGAFGGLVIAALPVLILLAALAMWWTNIGAETQLSDRIVIPDEVRSTE